MTIFNTSIKLNDMVYTGMNTEFFLGKTKALKAQLLSHYKAKEGSQTNKYKKVAELTAMFSYDNNEPTKRKIIEECAFSCFWLRSSTFPIAVYRSLLLLTFPLLAELTKLSLAFGENYFTPQLLINKLDGKWFENEVTKDSCCRAAIKTLCEVGVIKALKRGVLKAQIIPVYDAQGLEASLLTAVELGKSNANEIELFLRGLSFEISHEFIEFYNNIDYATIVPSEIWNEFTNSDREYSLQYKRGIWTVSKEPYSYLEINQPLSAIPRANYCTVEDIKVAKNEKIKFYSTAEAVTGNSNCIDRACHNTSSLGLSGTKTQK